MTEQQFFARIVLHKDTGIRSEETNQRNEANERMRTHDSCAFYTKMLAGETKIDPKNEFLQG